MGSTGIPARLTLLQDLRSFSPGAKVRFLGCITSYDPTSATLTLSAASATVDVNVSTPLPSLPMGSLRNGEWLNVIGYVAAKEEDGMVSVDAITVWSAGNVGLGEYERAVKERVELGL